MTEPRKPLSRREFGLILVRQDCRCAACGGKLDFSRPRRVIDEHIQPLFSGGSNDLDNRELRCVDCATAKTSKEAPGRAKVRRFEQGKTQADKRKARGGSSIQSAGFQKPGPDYKHKWPKRSFRNG